MAKNSFKRRSKMSKKRTNLSKRRNKVTRRRNKLSKRRNKVTRRRNKVTRRRNKVTRRRNNVSKKMRGGDVLFIDDLNIGDKIFSNEYGGIVGEIKTKSSRGTSIYLELSDDAIKAGQDAGIDLDNSYERFKENYDEIRLDLTRRQGKYYLHGVNKLEDQQVLATPPTPPPTTSDPYDEPSEPQNVEADAPPPSIEVASVDTAENFKGIDLLRDMLIQKIELNPAIDNISQLFDYIDTAGGTEGKSDGKISQREWTTKVGRIAGWTVGDIEGLIHAYHLIDLDQSGSIGYEEFSNFLTKGFKINCHHLPEDERQALMKMGLCVREETELRGVYRGVDPEATAIGIVGENVGVPVPVGTAEFSVKSSKSSKDRRVLPPEEGGLGGEYVESRVLVGVD